MHLTTLDIYNRYGLKMNHMIGKGTKTYENSFEEWHWVSILTLKSYVACLLNCFFQRICLRNLRGARHFLTSWFMTYLRCARVFVAHVFWINWLSLRCFRIPLSPEVFRARCCEPIASPMLTTGWSLATSRRCRLRIPHTPTESTNSPNKFLYLLMVNLH